MEHITLDLLDSDDCARWDSVFVRHGGLPSWIYSTDIIKYYYASGNIDIKLWLLSESGVDISACMLATPRDSSGIHQISQHMGVPYPFIFATDIRRRRKGIAHSFDFLRDKISYGDMIYLTDFGQNINNYEETRWKILDYTSNYYVNRVMLVDLRHSVDELEARLHKYMKRNIKRTYKDPSMSVTHVDHRNSIGNIHDAVDVARNLHFKAAGRVTRPIETWEQIEVIIKNNRGSLTLLKYKGEAISYLIAFSQGDRFAVGASQANLEGFLHLNPRHRLEWEVILYYKSRGFISYEIGQRYVISHPLREYSEKEIEMTKFKERLGGYIAPRVHGYLSHDENVLRNMWDVSRIR